MELNKKLDIRKYLAVKESAYTFAKVLDKNRIVKLIQNLEIEDPEEATIYITTLLYPNDLDIIPIVEEKQDLEQLSNFFNIPSKILQLKAREYAKYNLLQLLKQNETLNNLCRDQSNFSNNEAINEIISSKLK